MWQCIFLFISCECELEKLGLFTQYIAYSQIQSSCNVDWLEDNCRQLSTNNAINTKTENYKTLSAEWTSNKQPEIIIIITGYQGWIVCTFCVYYYVIMFVIFFLYLNEKGQLYDKICSFSVCVCYLLTMQLLGSFFHHPVLHLHFHWTSSPTGIFDWLRGSECTVVLAVSYEDKAVVSPFQTAVHIHKGRLTFVESEIFFLFSPKLLILNLLTGMYMHLCPKLLN